MGASAVIALEVSGNTLMQLKWPILTISTVLGFAYIMYYSGMSISPGYTFASTGRLTPLFAAALFISAVSRVLSKARLRKKARSKPFSIGA